MLKIFSGSVFLALCFIFITISINAYGQSDLMERPVTISSNGESLKRNLNKLEKLLPLRFGLINEDIDVNAKLTFEFKNSPFRVVLKKICTDLDLTYQLVNDFIILKKTSPVKKNETQGLISGNVRDTDGAPVAGATVSIKGSGVATSTKDDGSFTLYADHNNVSLEISSIGYETAVQDYKLYSQAPLLITLKKAVWSMESVVVVGYGRQNKRDVTSSVSSVRREEIMQSPSASVQNVLAGRLTGFFSQQRGGQPGRDGAQFFVRGVSTFNGDQSPLILIDDIESTYDDFSNIDPNEVESVSILKDAAATAVYGVKGANGVVLVTTRRGKTGRPKVNFRTEYGIQRPTHVPKLLDAANTAMLYNEALKNDALLLGGTYTPLFSEEDIELYRNGQDPYGHPNVDWYNTLIKKQAPMSTNRVDISGGTETVQYFLSLGYLRQDGLLKHIQAEGADINNNYRFDRYNFRSNLDIKATKSLSFRLDISGNNTALNAPKFMDQSASGETAVFYEIYNFESLKPFGYPIYNPDGSFGYADLNLMPPAGLSNNIVGRIAYGGYSRQLQNLINGAVSGTQKLDAITPGLELRALLSVVNSNSATRTIQRDDFPSYYYDPQTDTYTPRNTNVYRVSPFSYTYSSGDPRRQTTIQANLNYNRSFGDNNVSALLLYNQNSRTRNITGDEAATASYVPINFRGYTSRVSYNFRNKYLLEFNGSYNGSTRFDVNHRWGFFPAGSVGWNIAEEGFMKPLRRVVSLLKLRGSYGIVGSDDIGDARNAYQESYTFTSNAYSFGTTHNNHNAVYVGILGNDNVTWEKERKANIGLDFSFFKSRLSGSVDVFSNERYDILTSRNTIPFYFGVATDNLPPENIGRVSNKGYEVELNYNGKIAKDVRLNMKGTYSYAKNKILEMDEVPALLPWRRQTGQSIGAVPQWIWEGFYTQEEIDDPSVAKYAGNTIPGFLKYRDLDGDGMISDLGDKGYFGKPNLPTTVLGLNTAITYKRLSFSVFLQSALDFDVQIGYNLVAPFKGNLQAIHLKRWTPETAATAEFPALVTNFHGTYMSPGSNSDFWAISGNYLRIKSMELSYKLPENWMRRVGLNNATIYMNGSNLKTWSKTYSRFQLDPEVARGGSAPGYQGVYPQEAIYNIGINISIL